MTLAQLSIPRGWEEITPAWMTGAIRRRHPDAVVSDVEVVLRDDGTNRRARLGLTYSAGTGPATVFAKAADPAHVELVALTSGLFHEPRLFTSGVVLPLDHPTVYTAIIDEEGSDFLMIMEDVVARGADPRDSTRPLTVDQRLGKTAQRVLGPSGQQQFRTRLGRALRPVRRSGICTAGDRIRAIGRFRSRRDPRNDSQ